MRVFCYSFSFCTLSTILLLLMSASCGKKGDRNWSVLPAAKFGSQPVREAPTSQEALLQTGEFLLRILDTPDTSSGNSSGSLDRHYTLKVEDTKEGLERVVVSVRGLEGVSFLSFEIGFDPAKHAPVSVENLGFMGDEDETVFLAVTNIRGRVPIAIARILPQENESVSGSGQTIAVEFERATQSTIHYVSKPPGKDPYGKNDLKIRMGSYDFFWEEARAGDWNNDGKVNSSDILPTAYHFGASTDPASPLYWNYAQYLDHNDSGSIDASDVLPIGLHFGEETAEYHILEGLDENGAKYIQVATVPRPDVPVDPKNPPWNISLAPLTYGTQSVESWWPKVGLYYQVVPADSQGRESKEVRSPWARFYRNNAPVPVVKATPTSGPLPLTVTFDARDSYDLESEIVLYQWDFDGDHKYDLEETNGLTQYTYSEFGTYYPALQVTDTDGSTGRAGVQITAGYTFKTWGTRGADKANRAAMDSKGNIFAVGSTEELGPDYKEALILKYASDGEVLWAKSWGGSYWNDEAQALSLDSSDNFYVGGYAFRQDQASPDAFLLKFDNDGDMFWSLSWGGPYWDEATGVAVNSSGDIFLSGNTDSNGNGSLAVFLNRFDGNGNLIWSRNWDGDRIDEVQDITLTSTGDVILLGSTSSFDAGGTDLLLLKFNGAGDLLWARTWGGNKDDRGTSVAVDSQGNILALGSTSSFGAGGSDLLLLKFDQNGDLIWGRTYGNEFDNYGRAIFITSDIYVSGNGGVMRFDGEGELVWPADSTGPLGSDSSDPSALIVMADGTVLTIQEEKFFKSSSYNRTVGIPTGSTGSPAGLTGVPPGVLGGSFGTLKPLTSVIGGEGNSIPDIFFTMIYP